MGTQTEIKAGKPRVLDVDQRYPGLLKVEIPLDPHPDHAWTQIFNNGPSGVSFSISMHPPQVVGGKVKITPPDDELERYVDHVTARVEATNRNYEERIEPKLRAQRAAEEHERAERTRRIEEAQRRLSKYGA